MFFASLCLVVQQGLPVADSLTLEGAIDAARRRRGTVTAIAAGVDEQRVLRRAAGRPPNPTVELSSMGVEPSRRLTVLQSFAPLARLPFERSAAAMLVEGARADSAQRMANLERDVARAFFAVVAAEQRAALLAALRQLTDSITTLAGRRESAGDISDLDRMQFALEGVRVRVQHSRAVELLGARRAALARELATAVESLPPTAERLDRGLAAEASDSPVEGGGDAARAGPRDDVERVPEVRRARALARAAAMSERSLRWGRLPVPGLVVQRDWSRTPGIPSTTRLGLSIPLPLFSQGTETLDIGAARARAASAQADEVALESARALAAARIRVAESARRARLTSDSLVAGVVRLREGALRLYDAGRTTVLQVLEALRAEREAQLIAIDETLLYQDARAELAALAGRSAAFPAVRSP